MSVLTDFFTSLANKIRSKTGNSATMTPSEMIDEIDNIATPLQTKTVTASTSATTVTPDNGYALSSVTINPTPSQTKSATPSTSAQTISPDSGKLLSSVSVAAISPNYTSNGLIVPRWGVSAGSSVPASTISTRNPRIDFNNSNAYGSAEMLETAMPKGYYSWSHGNSGCCIPTETKTVTATTSAQTVTPTGYNTAGQYVKYLKSVTVNPQSHSGTYTFAANDTGGTKDLGEKHTYRYVNASNVYNKGKADGSAYDSGHIYVSTSLSESNTSNKITCTSWSGGIASFNVPVGTYVFFIGGIDDSFLYKSFAGTVVYNSGQQKAGSTRALVFVLKSTGNSKLEIWLGNGFHTHASYRLA